MIDTERVSTKCLENEHQACPQWCRHGMAISEQGSPAPANWEECLCPCHMANALDLKRAALENMHLDSSHMR